MVVVIALFCSMFAVTVYATTTKNDVAGTLQDTFDNYIKPQIIKFVEGVMLPVIDVILVVSFVFNIVMAGVNYKKNPGGEFEWRIPALLFLGLVISISATLWMWGIIGWGPSAQAA